MTNRIKDLREAFSLTQEQLGEMLGVRKAAVAKYESGTVENLKRSTVEKMADIFKVTPAFIMGWSDNPQELKADELRLLELFGKLNSLGKKEAIKRVAELSVISVYNSAIINTKELIAAHDGGASPQEMNADLLNALEILKRSDKNDL
ncbi:MAG: helix-turn-helix transcriptional regulator [Firmicutes bacterium]|nr:helix-turn-helix transcriptional regulator [Bacillota bacterium]